MLMAAAFGLQCGGSALGRLVVVALSAHLLLRPLLRSPSGALRTREAQIAQERLGTAVGLHRSAPSDNWCERAYSGRLQMDRTRWGRRPRTGGASRHPGGDRAVD